MRMDSVFVMCKDVMKQTHQDYNVPEMTSSLEDDLEKELNGLIESKEYTLSCRLKVYFLGDKNAGKTSLVRSLVGENACMVNMPSESTTHHVWRPLKDPDNSTLLKRRPSLDERNLTLDLWDLPGRKVCQGIHQMFLSRALYVLVFNLVDSESCLQLPKYISYVQAKIPGCPMLIVATRADKLFTADDRAQKAEVTMAGVRAAQQAEVDAIKNDITQISEIGADPKLLDQLEWLEGLLQHRPKMSSPIQVVSCKTGKGLVELRRELVRLALDCELFPHTGELLSPGQVRLCELLGDEKARGKVLLTWAEYRDLALGAVKPERNGIIQDDKPTIMTDTELRKTVALFEKLGIVCSFPALTPPLGKSTPTHYMCVAPQKLSGLLCCSHVDNQRKTFHLDGKRFWPELGQRPDPATLIKYLEEIPFQGIIREILLPLLWQHSILEEEQIHRILDLLLTSGLFTPYGVCMGEVKVSPTHSSTNHQLTLPTYGGLSQNKRYHANLMGLLPDKRPLLNWSPKPFKGDVQVTWRYSFPCGTPPGLTQRMLGACRATTTNYFYLHQWRYGLLAKMDDAVVCVELDTVDLCVDVSCRVNADDPTEEEEAVSFMWAHLAPFIQTTRHLLHQWPGLVYRLELVAFGTVFYRGQTMGGDQTFLVGQCFMSARTQEHITYTEGGVERALDGVQLLQLNGREHNTLDEWLEDLLSTRQTVIERRCTTPLASPPKSLTQKDTTAEGNPPPPKQKKKLEVKWRLSGDDDSMMNRPVVSADTGSNKTKGSDENEATSGRDIQQSPSKTDRPASKSPVDNVKDGRFFLTGEQEEREATRVASGFVASLLAQAVADYIQAVHDDNHTAMGQQTVTKAQVDAARLAARAAVAAQTGEIDNTARAVMEAAKSLQTSSHTQQAARSKTCVVL